MSVSHNYNQQNPTSSHNNPNPSSSSYYPNTRARANTINQGDNAVPAALARLTQMNKDLTGIGRNTLTPIINRAEDPLQQWERRAQGKAPPAQAYPPLEYLQQQAEMAPPGGWKHSGGTVVNRYPLQYQTPVQLLMDNQERRRNRASQRADYGSNMPAPPQSSYSGNETNLSNLYVPMQPNQYSIASGSTQTQPSLYGGSVVPSGQQQGSTSYGQKQSYQMPPASSRRSSGVGLESWTQGA
jgi:dual specificity protein kinase YAK1